MLLTVPRSWGEVTPAWLAAAMGRPVAELRLDDIAEGTNSRARITGRFADRDEAFALFVKREGRVLNRLALTALGAREAEADLARYGVDLPVEHPAFYA